MDLLLHFAYLLGQAAAASMWTVKPDRPVHPLEVKVEAGLAEVVKERRERGPHGSEQREQRCRTLDKIVHQSAPSEKESQPTEQRARRGPTP